LHIFLFGFFLQFKIVIRLLQQENEDLKEALKEHQSVLEYIMTKYREQMLKFIQLKREQEITENIYKTALAQVGLFH
jgi:hypothetical protein